MPGSSPEVIARPPSGRADLEALRVRGHKGGIIAPHRAMVGLPWTAWRFLTTLLLAVGGLAGYLAALPWLGRGWQLLFVRARDFLGISAPVGTQTLELPGGISFNLPVVATLTPLPDTRVLWIAGIASVAVFLLSFLLPLRFTPLRYFLRLLVLVQASAIAFFALSPEPFPYRLEDHVFILLTAGLVVMGLVPLVLGLTLHVFDLAFWRKLLLTVLILAHLAVFVPLNVLVHVWLVLSGTAVVMPVLFLVFGLLLDVFIFVAFYGTALSWRGTLEGRDAPPVHL
jgi:hypothetical protein